MLRRNGPPALAEVRAGLAEIQGATQKNRKKHLMVPGVPLGRLTGDRWQVPGVCPGPAPETFWRITKNLCNILCVQHVMTTLSAHWGNNKLGGLYPGKQSSWAAFQGKEWRFPPLKTTKQLSMLKVANLPCKASGSTSAKWDDSICPCASFTGLLGLIKIKMKLNLNVTLSTCYVV